MRKLSVIIFYTLVNAMTAQAQPKALILLRHAEEPTQDVNYLSAVGMKRAQELPRIFTENTELKTIGYPDYIFAAGAKKQSSSIRSIQTVTPLAQFLKTTVQDQFNRDDYQELIQELGSAKYDNKIVVICWQHKKLPLFAKAFGIKSAPNSFEKNFDRFWLITYDSNGKGRLLDLPQNIMPGDSTH